jgi:hypothetical protein
MSSKELERQAVERFDRLNELGELLWHQSSPIIVSGKPFNVRSLNPVCMVEGV